MSSAPRKPVVGLIGGIGSGKSLVAAEFARRGARVVSGDEAGHEALRQPAIREEVVRRWGIGLLNAQGEIERRRLAAIVFQTAEELRALEALVFPWIGQRLREQIGAAQGDGRVCLVLLDAAVLLEAGWHGMCDHVVYIHAPRAVRLRRLTQQRRWSEAEVRARERSQWPLTEKVSRADAALENSGPPDELPAAVDRLFREWGVVPTAPAPAGT